MRQKSFDIKKTKEQETSLGRNTLGEEFYF
jgi:hypothetical protein